MGFDKAGLKVNGRSNLDRLASVMCTVAAGPVAEVGVGASGLPATREEPPGRGPLVAMVAGAAYLARAFDWRGDVLVVACDLPFLTAEALAVVAAWPAPQSAVPLWEGRLQPLCARWAAADLVLAAGLVATGSRSLQALVEKVSLSVIDSGAWGPAHVLADVDTPQDLDRFGLGGNWHG
jgi:molybdopterin-guanine dinucleotide biosynthesis protein A